MKEKLILLDHIGKIEINTFYSSTYRIITRRNQDSK